MKSWLCNATAAAAVLFLVPSAHAADAYAFADYNYIDTTDHSLNGFDAGLGLAFGQHFGTELGYIYASGSGSSVNGGLLDLIYRFPLGRSRFSLFTTVGGEYADAHDSQWGIRAGGGLEYHVSESVVLRVGARYQSAIDDGVIANAGFVVGF